MLLLSNTKTRKHAFKCCSPGRHSCKDLLVQFTNDLVLQVVEEAHSQEDPEEANRKLASQKPEVQ